MSTQSIYSSRLPPLLAGAVTTGNEEKMNELMVIFRGMYDINYSVDSKGRNLLYTACKYGHLSLVRILIGMGADVRINKPQQSTPLAIAVSCNHSSIVLALVSEYRYDLNNVRGVLHEACKHGNLSMIKMLIEHGAHVDEKDGDGSTPLHLAVGYNKHEIAAELLSKCDPNIQDKQGMTPLHIACIDGDLSMVKSLIDHGARVDDKDYDGNTPFSLALKYKEYTLALVLLSEFKCDPNTKNNQGEIPLHMAYRGGGIRMISRLIDHGACVNDRDSILNIALKSKQYRITMMLLSELKCDPNTKDENGMGPLHNVIACQGSDLKIMKSLVDHGARINDKDSDGNTPFTLALKLKKYRFALVLLNEYKCDLNCSDRQGMTPLHIACRDGDYTMVKTLIDHGADVNEKDVENMRALHLALKAERINFDIILTLDKNYSLFIAGEMH